jgi:hypothetical protein
MILVVSEADPLAVIARAAGAVDDRRRKRFACRMPLKQRFMGRV